VFIAESSLNGSKVKELRVPATSQSHLRKRAQLKVSTPVSNVSY
jgi:hypothetical protein